LELQLGLVGGGFGGALGNPAVKKFPDFLIEYEFGDVNLRFSDEFVLYASVLKGSWLSPLFQTDSESGNVAAQSYNFLSFVPIGVEYDFSVNDQVPLGIYLEGTGLSWSGR